MPLEHEPDFAKDGQKASRAVALLSDVLSSISIPSALVGQAINELMDRRRAAAREALLAEIEEGSTEFEIAAVQQIDEFAAIALRYIRAAEEGARARNLRLLAKIFARQIQGRKADSDRFTSQAAAIEGLTDRELNLLGKWLAHPDIYLKELGDLLESSDEERQEARQLAASMMRLGLVLPGSGYGGLNFSLTPIAKAILQDLSPEDMTI